MKLRPGAHSAQPNSLSALVDEVQDWIPCSMTRRCILASAAGLLISVTSGAAASTPLVNPDDVWSYHKGTSAAQAGWTTAAAADLDATWLEGPGGIGYADSTGETANCQTLLPDMRNRYTTLYLRRQFTVTDAVSAEAHLYLRMDWDDGYIAWLDGIYLTSANVTGAPAEPSNSATASANHESSLGNSSPQAPVVNDLGPASDWLLPGTHTLAVMGLNQSSSSSDFIQIPSLYLEVPPPPVTNVWTVADSPVVVTADLTVADREVLVIEPGVTVELGAGVDLTVANGGCLLAEGAADAPIRFTRSGPSGYWGNLTVNGGAHSPETRISHAHFEFNANSTGTPCIQVSAGTVFLDHLTFDNPGAPYIHVDGASFVISHCDFPAATASFEPVHGTDGVRSDGHGIFTRNFFGKARGYSDVVDFTGGKRPGPIVHFIENVLIGGDDDGFDIDGTDAWVEGNLFLHFHRNGSTPDSASGVSGGDYGGRTSEMTLVGNLFYDCDQAAAAKQGNFYTMINNTVVHQTHEGGIDPEGAVIIMADEGTSQGAGCYLEGNVIHDVEQLTRNVTTALVTFTDNLMPFAWDGPGGGNSTADPMFVYVPGMEETYFADWEEAQVVRAWFSLQSGSPGIGTGPNGVDQGFVISRGVSISGEPDDRTASTEAVLTVGFNRAGSGIATAGWPSGSGYTDYRWRLDGGDWSSETPIAAPITLTDLAPGPHHVEVSGKLDSGLYQDDPLFGEAAVVTRSRTWTVLGLPVLKAVRLGGDNPIQIRFTAQADTGYVLEFTDSLSAADWKPLQAVAPIPSAHEVEITDDLGEAGGARFYRVAF